jgi:hypothetical protein
MAGPRWNERTALGPAETRSRGLAAAVLEREQGSAVLERMQGRTERGAGACRRPATGSVPHLEGTRGWRGRLWPQRRRRGERRQDARGEAREGEELRLSFLLHGACGS